MVKMRVCVYIARLLPSLAYFQGVNKAESLKNQLLVVMYLEHPSVKCSCSSLIELNV